MDQQNVHTRIEALQIGPEDVALDFTQRLARENSWSLDFSERVIIEYKRFLYLVYRSGHEVTPSDQIDQAWHLHLTYTRSYWHDLCQAILGFELHHNPTRGGSAEQQRFEQQYLDTLTLYEIEFGEAPPIDIWPPLAQRFEAVEDFVRVNLRHKWILPRPRKWIERGALLGLLPLVLVACTDNLAEKDFWFWIKLAFGLLLMWILVKWLRTDHGGKKGDKGQGGGGGCGGCGGCGG